MFRFLRYPAWFDEVDCELIERAFLTAVAKLKGHFPGVLSPYGYAESEAEAVQFVLDVATVVVQRLQRRLDQQPPGELRRVADDLLGQIIVWVERQQLAPTTLEAFETRVHEALATQSWWRQFQTVLSALGTKAKTSRKRTTPDAERLKADRRVVLLSLDELDWTPTKWATEAGVDPSVTLGYFKGVSTRAVHHTRLRNTLANALKKPAFQLPK